MERKLPTRETLENVKRAEERMNAASKAQLAFRERPNPQYTPEEIEKNKRLLDNLRYAIAEYWEAFEHAAKS